MQREASSTSRLRRFFPSPGAWKSFFLQASARFSIDCSIFPLTSRPFGAGKKVSTTPAVFACSSSSVPLALQTSTKVASILIMPHSPQARSAGLGIFSLQRLQLLLLPKFSPSSSSMGTENSPSGVSMINFPFEILFYLTESRSTENFSTIIFLAVSGLIEPPQFSPKMRMFSSLTSPRFASS